MLSPAGKWENSAAHQGPARLGRKTTAGSWPTTGQQLPACPRRLPRGDKVFPARSQTTTLLPAALAPAGPGLGGPEHTETNPGGPLPSENEQNTSRRGHGAAKPGTKGRAHAGLPSWGSQTARRIGVRCGAAGLVTERGCRRACCPVMGG